MESLRVIFYGTPTFSTEVFRALLAAPEYSVPLVVTQPDRPAGRGKKLQASPVKELAIEHDIPLIQPGNIKKNLDAFLSEASTFGPFDVGVVVAFGQILPTQVLQLPTHGCINIHASLLPRWRGAAPIQRAIMAGDEETGVCLMQMEAGLDTGGVFSSVTTRISPEDNAGSLHDRLSTLGAKLLVEDLARIVAGNLSATPQPKDGVTYAHKIEKEEASINWDQEASILENFVRGLAPWPGAFTTLGKHRLKIFSLRARNDFELSDALER